VTGQYSVIDRLADLAAVGVGLNTKRILQFFFPARAETQLLDWEKSPAFVPSGAIWVIVDDSPALGGRLSAHLLR
jgi:hypothetical protein